MTTIQDLMVYLDEVAPFRFQESYDNAGLLVGDPNMKISGVTTSLDMTEEVIDEAIANKHNVVVAHHPIIFSGLKTLTGKTYIERAVIKAIKNDIALIAIHTNLDHVYNHGVNELICKKLGLKEIKILQEKPDAEYPSGTPTGAGMVGLLPKSMSQTELLGHIKSQMLTGCIKYTESSNKEYKKIAVCGGAGRFLLDKAIAAGAECFISSDFKYHEFFDANGQIMIADIGHYESEQYTIQLLQQLISNKFSNFASLSTKAITNPVNYYI